MFDFFRPFSFVFFLFSFPLLGIGAISNDQLRFCACLPLSRFVFKSNCKRQYSTAFYIIFPSVLTTRKVLLFHDASLARQCL